LLAYAAKLTESPAAVIDDDIATLRDAGFSDEQIWEATYTTSIFAMFNRMADAFGIQPTEQMLIAFERL
jgi:alkylhydroperoxidase family enzyme